MKLIKVIVHPCQLDTVRNSFADVGIQDVTYVEALGLVSQQTSEDIWEQADATDQQRPRLVIEAYVDDRLVSLVLKSLQRLLRDLSDGSIAVMPVEAFQCLKTGHQEGAVFQTLAE